MKLIQPFLLLPFLFTLSVWSATPVPYSGKIDIRGVNYFGDAQFTFSLHDGNGTTHWRNGKQPGETIKVTIRNGRYTVLLGGQGMNSLPTELFLNHDKLYLKVEVDMGDGEGLRHLAPDQLITATPRALVAEVAKVAQVAEKVGNGAITRDMLSSEVLAQLDANVTASPSTPVTITRDMLPQDVRDDLNKTVTITRSMLPADVLADLNKSSTTASPITLSMLAPEVTAKLDQNATIGASSITKSMLAQEVLNDLNASTNVINPPVVGSIISFPSGQPAPAGYSLYQRGEPKELVWEEKAPVSVARYAYDGVEVLDGKIYFVGGKDGSGVKNIAERYDPVTNTWEALNSMSVARAGLASAVLNGKLYAIGGEGLSSVEVFDPNTGNWTAGVALPSEVNHGTAITVSDKIYLVGGRNSLNQDINQVLSFDPSTNQWIAKANMPTARHGHKLVWFEGRIWAIGGSINKVESYAPTTNSWQNEVSLTTGRNWPVAWIANGRIYCGGGQNLNSTEYYDPVTKQWSSGGNFPENKYGADAVVLNDKAYIMGGSPMTNVYSNKVFAADLNASVDGIYDLYRKDGDAHVGTPVVQSEYADGSVTASKMAEGSVSKSALDATILKYLKPEITTQPQASTILAGGDGSVSFSAEGKYLSHQWKKDGLDLAGETNATLKITDANATLHDGNYSVVVSNDFGSVESNLVNLSVVVFDPSHIGNLIGWFDANDSSTVLLENNTVKEWLDKSDLKNNFSQILPESMPEYSNNSIVFDGLNDSLSWGNPQTRNTFNIFLVKKSSDTKSLDFWGQTASFYIFVQQQNSSSFVWHAFGIPKTFINGLSYNFTNRGNAYTVVHDGQLKLISILDGDTSGWTDFRIGNYPSYEFAGAFHEIIFLEGEIEYITRNRIEGYLAHKWGLTANLPANHPYKNNAP